MRKWRRIFFQPMILLAESDVTYGLNMKELWFVYYFSDHIPSTRSLGPLSMIYHIETKLDTNVFGFF